jgi:hypothetical protein
MSNAIIYPNESGGIALVLPTGEIPIEDVITKDVPAGKPYHIVNYSDIPNDLTFFDAWEADFTNAPVAGS